MIDMTVLDMMLMHYAAGALSPPESFVVAMHLALKPEARKKVSGYEALGGHMMEKEEPAPLKSDCLSTVLARIDCPPCDEAKTAKKMRDLGLPAEAQALIDCYCAESIGDWRRKSLGLEMVDLLLCSMPHASRRLRLMRFGPHYKAPNHSHKGREITLVLDGGYYDDTGIYQKGDIAILDDPALKHAPQAMETGCLCLVLTEVPLRYTSPGMRFLSLFSRI